MKTPKPEPVVVTTICSLCGEAWQAHGDNPDTLDCIRLLKAKAARGTVTIYRDRWYPSVPAIGYPAPIPPVWYGTDTPITCGGTGNLQGVSSGSYTVNATTTTRTPAIVATCSAVAP